MKLYVANCTKQHQTFVYRTLGQTGVKQQPIHIGQQIMVTGRDDLTKREIDYILEQHRRYGIIAVDEINRVKPYAGMCYSVDKPIQIEAIMSALDHNQFVLAERGAKMREEASVAVHNQIERNLSENPEMNTRLRETETTVIEEDKPGHEQPKMAEGVVVSRDDERLEERGRQRKARKRR